MGNLVTHLGRQAPPTSPTAQRQPSLRSEGGGGRGGVWVHRGTIQEAEGHPVTPRGTSYQTMALTHLKPARG